MPPRPGWIEAHLPADGSVHVEDVTSRYAWLCLWGPRAREVLAPLAEADVSAAGVSYLTAAELNVGPVPCLAVRVTFVGELGWELYCPAEYGGRCGTCSGSRAGRMASPPAATAAIESLRLEKGYRVWGSDITSVDTPFEAGLGFAVAMAKEDFIGGERSRSAGRRRGA